MGEEINQGCSVGCAIRKVEYLTAVYNTQEELVSVICALYTMGYYTQEEIGWKVMGEEMERSVPITISLIKKLLEQNLDEHIRIAVDAIRREENLQYGNSAVQAARGRIAGAQKVLPSDVAKSMNGIESLSPIIVQKLVKQHAVLTAKDAPEQLSSEMLRKRLAEWLYETYQVEKTRRAVQGVLSRYKKKLERGGGRNEISTQLREEIYTHWEESFPKNGSPSVKSKWYTQYAEQINTTYSFEGPFIITGKNVKNAIQRMNQKKKKKESSS